MDSSISIPQQFFKVVSEILDEHIKLKNDLRDTKEGKIMKSQSFMELCCGGVSPAKGSSWENTQSDDEVSRKSTTAHISTPPRNWWELWRQVRGEWGPDSRTTTTEDLSSSKAGQLDVNVADQGPSSVKEKLFSEPENDDAEKLLASYEYDADDDRLDRITKLRNLKLLLEKVEAIRNKRKSKVAPATADDDVVESNSSVSTPDITSGEIRLISDSRIEEDSSETESGSEVDEEVSQIENFLTRRRLRLTKNEFDRAVDSTEGLRSDNDLIFWDVNKQAAPKGEEQSLFRWRRFVPNIVLRAFQKSTNTCTTTNTTAKGFFTSGWNKLKFQKGVPIAPAECALGNDDNHMKNVVDESTGTPTESLDRRPSL